MKHASQGRGPWLLVAMLLAAGVSAAAGPAVDRQASTVVPDHIRPLDRELAATVASGLAHSATFTRLVERIGALKGIVYVRSRAIVQVEARRTLDGALLHRVTRAGTHRLLHVMVAPGSRERTVAVLAHEFQHVIELLEAGVSSEAEADALFERIGVQVGAHVVETHAAIDVEHLVRRELELASEGDAP